MLSNNSKKPVVLCCVVLEIVETRNWKLRGMEKKERDPPVRGKAWKACLLNEGRRRKVEGAVIKSTE